MSKEVGLTTDETDKSLTSWTEGEIFLSNEVKLSVVTDVFSGTNYYLDPIQEKYIEITANFETFISSSVYDLPFVGGTANIQHFVETIDEFINSTAISYGYDSIDNAISYYNSLDPTKREEARSFSDWRDSVLSLADTNIYGFTADGVTLPDLAGFTGQTGYAEFSVVPIPTTFFGDEDAGYHITDLENRIFTAWINVDHQGINSGLGQSIQIPFPSGNITDIYSISGIVDQGSQTSDWLNANYSLKIKFSGTANSYGVQTEFDYMIHSLDGYTATYNGLVPRFTIIGGY